MWLLADVMRRYHTHYGWNVTRFGDPPATAHYCAWESVNTEIDRALYGDGMPRAAFSKPNRGHAALNTPWPL